MIEVDLFFSKQGYLDGFSVQGHAGQGDVGQDIVCAAISAITQTTVIGLSERLKVDVQLTIEHGLLAVHLPEGLTAKQEEEADLLIDTMRLGIISTQKEYPDCIEMNEWR